MRFIESETVEYKESLIQLKKGVISIVSILNKHKKGRIIFGIQDDGTVKGVSVGKNTLREISKSISDNIEPKIYPEIKEDLIEGKQCVVIDFLGKNIPYFAFGRAYVRTADEDRLLSSKELEELILKKNKYNLKWDEDICLNANLSDISSKKLKEYVLKAGLKYISKKETLENLELMKVDKLTNASIILLKISTEILLGFNTQKSFVISGTRNVPFL
ncbi:MAG: putative DNA binding domain-containing protein, partial [Nanoarchaeota archaeon]|nr:putative DNA binding domain-containing protein [Nanoarchaeota archaeon]